MIESQRSLLNPQPYNYDNNPSIQSQPTCLNQYFFFNRLKMLYTYITDIRKQTLFKYNQNFKPVLTSTRILDKFIFAKQNQRQFNITNQLFKMEQRNIIILIILSILAGGVSLVPLYFQQILVKAVLGNTGNYYSLGVVIGVVCFRFLLLNYMLNLSSNIAINLKLYLQNIFMRLIYLIDNQKYPHLQHALAYLDLNLIGETLFYLPYFFISVILVIGLIIFVFLNVGAYGCIVLAIYLTLWIFIAVMGYLAYNRMKVSRTRVAQRQQVQRKTLQNMFKMAFQRISDYAFQMLIIQKKLQTNENLGINIQYILGQTFGQCCIVLSNIALYALSSNQKILKSQAYYSVLFLVSTFYPMRYIVYGFFTLIKGIEAYGIFKIQLNSISKKQIKKIKINPSNHNKHTFIQNIGPCFQYQYKPITEAEKYMEKQINIKVQSNQYIKRTVKRMQSISQFNQPVQPGKITMILSRVDSIPSLNDYFQQFLRHLNPKDTVAYISQKAFLLPQSIRQNICFYSPFQIQKYKRIVNLVQLSSLGQQILIENTQQAKGCLMLSDWHQARIQLARALYANVQYLLINRPILLQNIQLLNAVMQQRRKNNKITVIANNLHKYFFKLSDKIIVIGRKQTQIGVYKQLSLSKQSLFNKLFLRHHQKVNYTQKIPQQKQRNICGVLVVPKQDQNSVHLQKGTFFQLFALIHKKSQFIVLLALFIPVGLKYYLQNLIGQSLLNNIFTNYLIIGLIYLLFIFIRGCVITIYANYGSFQLYKKICQHRKALNAQQMMKIIQQPVTDIAFHQRLIDRNLVMDFEYGQSILIQIIVSFIVYCTGQQYYIFVAIPTIVAIVFLNGNFAKNARKLYLLKLKQSKNIHKVVQSTLRNTSAISRYQKINEVNAAFTAQNKIQLIYDSNIQWLETGVRTFSQINVIILFTIFLIIMIYTVQNQTIYTSLVSLGCSMFINLLYLNSFYLKAFRQMEISLVSLTMCFNTLKKMHLPEQQLIRSKIGCLNTISQVQSIKFKDISLQLSRQIAKDVNFVLNAGDRVVLSGNSNSLKQYVLYMLDNRILGQRQIKGDIIINDKIFKQFQINGLYFLHAQPLIPYFGTVLDALKISQPTLTQQNVNKQLEQFFQNLALQVCFQAATDLQSLRVDQIQLLQVFRVVEIQQCQVLVIINGFDHIDIVSRRKLTKYLLNSISINILIETTNVTEAINLYPRHLIFQNKTVTQHRLGQQQQKRRLKRMQSKMSQREQSQKN